MRHCLIEALTEYNVCHPLISECLPADKIMSPNRFLFIVRGGLNRNKMLYFCIRTACSYA